MRDYELTVLFHPDLEMNLDPAVNKVKKILTSNGGEITKEENDGKKRLSYKIDGQEFAVFYYFDVQLPTEAPLKVSNTLNITDEVLRHLLVRADTSRPTAVASDTEPAASTEKVEDDTDKSTKKGE
ncbi:30S ribosomal protein S6 [Candidatus Saccharibacteria bacterium]|nr:30S ribosomal protein S6 [Candidatus Saccharibacteria bacterium]